MPKVIVVVPKRDPHPGFWVLQRFFPVGKTEVEVTDEQLEELKADEARGFIAVVEPPKPPTAEELLTMAAEAEEKAKQARADAEKLKAKK